MQFFKPNGQRAIIQHPLNHRKTRSALRSYVQKAGITQSVQGEPWLTYDEIPQTYHALRGGTLRLVDPSSSSGVI